MKITEKKLRMIIRECILEAAEKRDILGEPDLSAEEERDNPQHKVDDKEVDEASVVANIAGYSAPLGTKPQPPTVGIADNRPKKKKKKK